MSSLLAAEVASAFDDRRLQLFILPTEKCNFRCTYCYERFDVGRMSPETVRGVKFLIDRRAADLRSLSIEWFGGEPLLAKSVIYDISEHVISATRESDLRYTGSMTTNGYLLDRDTIATLAELGVRSFQISLDGPPDVHNKTRLRADGSETFSRIWANLLAVRDSDLPVKIMLRLHFTPVTAPTLAPLIDLINSNFAEDSRFTVAFKAIVRMGGLNDDKLPIFEHDAKMRTKHQLESLLQYPRQVRSLESMRVCYAAKPNSFVIRADGRIGKCTVALYDATNSVGTLTEDGKVRIDSKKLQPWMKGFQTLDLDELGCPLQKMRSVAAVASRRSLPLIETD